MGSWQAVHAGVCDRDAARIIDELVSSGEFVGSRPDINQLGREFTVVIGDQAQRVVAHVLRDSGWELQSLKAES